MEIILIRHGKSERTHVPKLSAQEYRIWKKEYDDMGVLPSNNSHFNEAQRNIARAEFVFTSELQRTHHSLSLLRAEMNPTFNSTSNILFNEANVRTPTLKGIRLDSGSWTLLTGACWYFGITQEHESKDQVKVRAAAACQLLADAAEHGTVALIGHGIINHYLFKELTRCGWKARRKYTAKNWSSTTLEKP